MNNKLKMISLIAATSVMIGTASLGDAGAAGAAQANKTKPSATSAATKQQTKSISEQANTKLKELTGKTYPLSKGNVWKTGNDTGYDFKISGVKNGEVNVINGQISRIQLTLQWPNLLPLHKKQLESILQSSGITNRPNEVSLSVDYKAGSAAKSQLEWFAVVDSHSLTILGDKVVRHVTQLTPETADPEIVRAAEEILQKIDGVTASRLAKAAYVKQNNKSMFELQFDGPTAKEPIFITMDETSRQAVKIDLPNIEDTPSEYVKGYAKMMALSPASLLKTAAPLTKQAMNIDLTGYSASKDKDHPGVVLFTKKYSPSIQGTYNTKGQFHKLEVVTR